jgi:hypothetical protein
VQSIVANNFSCNKMCAKGLPEGLGKQQREFAATQAVVAK